MTPALQVEDASIGRPSFLRHRIDEDFGRKQPARIPSLAIRFLVATAVSILERYRLQTVADFFNIFDNANFADPDNLLESPTFGQSLQMLATSLGSGGIEAGFSPLYQIGGPRSVFQLALKLTF